MYNKNKKIFINLFLLVIFVLLNYLLLINHEMWRDESQPWGIAINTTFDEMCQQLKVEGCPVLWFILLRILHFFQLKFSALGFVTLTITLISAIILMIYLELPLFTKTFFLFSSVFFYYNPVIARNYSLALLCIILLMITYQRRDYFIWRYSIIIATLFQTNVFTLGLCIGLTIEIFIRGFLQKKNKVLLSGLVPLFSGAMCAIELMQTPGVKAYINYSFVMIIGNLFKLKHNFNLIILAINTIYGISGKISYIVFLFFSISFIIVLIKLIFKGNIPQIIVLITSNFCWFFMYAIIKEGGCPINNIICGQIILIFTLYCIYIDCRSNSKKTKTFLIALITIISLLSVKKTFKDAYYDYKNDYSESKRVALFIENNLPNQSVILYNITPQISPLLTYIIELRPDILNIDIVNREEIKYHTWSKDYNKNNNIEYIDEYISLLKDKYFNIYYIESINGCNIDGVELVADFKSNADCSIADEKYKVYKIINE